MQLFRRQTQAGAPARRRKSRGQSLVEFALVLPILMLILLITVDFGRVFMGWVTLNNAARIAANYAASGQPPLTDTQIAQYQMIVARETTGINCDGLSTPVPTYPGGTAVGGRAVASLSCNFHFVTPFLGNLFPASGLPVGASSDFPIRSGVLAGLVPATPPATTAPNQDFTITPAIGVTGFNFSFTLLPQLGGAAETWLWTFGDSTTSVWTADPGTHPYGSPGTYTVTLKETNAVGSSQFSHTVVVTGAALAPVASFYGTVPAPCVSAGAPLAEACGGPPPTGSSLIYFTWPLTVNFTSTSTNTGGATYSWTFGDGSTSTSANPSHTYDNPGSFDVSLTVTTAAGTSTSPVGGYVNAGCIVPSFSGVSSGGNNATGLWTGANFQASNLFFWHTDGSYTTSNPNGGSAYAINQQNPQGKAFFVATPTNGNNYACTTTGRVAPTGANPVP